MERIPPSVAQNLGYYVYLLIDPRNGKPFYVGKGKGRRLLAHLSDTAESRKRRVLDELAKSGTPPRLEILAHALPSAETALRIEAAVIDLLGLGSLTNAVRGWRSVQLGRIPLADLVNYYSPRPVTIREPAILIRINKLYRHDMSDLELYEATRGVWPLGLRREKARLAMPVFHGIIRAVYEIDSWYPAASTAYETRAKQEVTWPGRWEFVAHPATEKVRLRYLGRSANRHLHGDRFPVTYVNC